MHSGQNRFPEWQNFLQEFPPYALLKSASFETKISHSTGHNVGIPTRSSVYKKHSKNMSSLDFDFLYSCFLFSRTHFG